MQRKRLQAVPLFSRRAVLTLGAVLAAGVVGVLIGCPSRPSVPPAVAPPAPPLRVACPDDGSASIVRGTGGRWASPAGRRLEVIRYEPPADPPPADVWLVAPAELPRWAAAGRLVPLPPDYQAPNNPYTWRNLLSHYPSHLLLWGREHYGLPVLGEGQVWYYRDDVFADAGHREAFRAKFGRDLAPPAFWEDVADLADFFAGRTWPGHERPGPSLPPLPAGDDDLDREFFAAAAPFARRARSEAPNRREGDHDFSFHYDLQTGQPLVNRPGFVEGLRLLQRLQSRRPAEPAAHPAEVFRSGGAVLCSAPARWAARFQEADSAVRGKFGVIPVPGSRRCFERGKGEEVPGGNFVPYLGAAGWVGVVPQEGTDVGAAFDLLAFLGRPDISDEVVSEPTNGGPIRRTQLTNAQQWRSFGLSVPRTQALVDALRKQLLHPQMLNPVVRLRIPRQRGHQQALLAEVRAALKGDDPQVCLDRAAKRWTELDAGTDVKTRLTEYRLSVGLRAAGE
jgi:multiple sugar transport system substrate-binding protein